MWHRAPQVALEVKNPPANAGDKRDVGSIPGSGRSPGVGCHFLLQCIKVKSESEVAQSCLTLSDPMDCSPPGSSIHGIFQARVLEWGATAFSKPCIRDSKRDTDV